MLEFVIVKLWWWLELANKTKVQIPVSKARFGGEKSYTSSMKWESIEWEFSLKSRCVLTQILRYESLYHFSPQLARSSAVTLDELLELSYQHCTRVLYWEHPGLSASAAIKTVPQTATSMKVWSAVRLPLKKNRRFKIVLKSEINE